MKDKLCAWVLESSKTVKKRRREKTQPLDSACLDRVMVVVVWIQRKQAVATK